MLVLCICRFFPEILITGDVALDSPTQLKSGERCAIVTLHVRWISQARYMCCDMQNIQFSTEIYDLLETAVFKHLCWLDRPFQSWYDFNDDILVVFKSYANVNHVQFATLAVWSIQLSVYTLCLCKTGAVAKAYSIIINMFKSRSWVVMVVVFIGFHATYKSIMYGECKAVYL